MQEPAHDAHPLGDCGECDLRIVAAMSMMDMEACYLLGKIGQDLYDAFMHTWVQVAPRSALYDAWKQVPEDEEIRMLVAALGPLMARTA
jgi:hypothetical protein